MVIEIKPRVTATEFDAFVALPDNADKIFELQFEKDELIHYP